VLLASAGLALLGVAGMAGLLFLFEHQRLKAKRALAHPLPLPSLEGLDRAGALALVVGFPLLTLGVVTGMLWQSSVSGRPWAGTPHEIWSGVAWAVYSVLMVTRFFTRQAARQAAASALVGFAFLLFAVVGVGMLA
jgi:ABC-type transport system involved in cytochrome c biogenesis permease subunit